VQAAPGPERAQNERRAYVALGRATPLRDGLRSQVCHLYIAMSCYEVSQPDACPALANSMGWGRSVPTQDIRPPWQAGHTGPASFCVGGASAAAHSAGGTPVCGWSSARHTASLASRIRFAKKPKCRIRWNPLMQCTTLKALCSFEGYVELIIVGAVGDSFGGSDDAT